MRRFRIIRADLIKVSAMEDNIQFDTDLWYAPLGSTDGDLANVQFPSGSNPLGKHQNGYEIAWVKDAIRDKLGRSYTHGAPDGIPTNPCDPRRIGVDVGDVVQVAHKWVDNEHNGGSFFTIWHYKVTAVHSATSFNTLMEFAGNAFLKQWIGRANSGFETLYSVNQYYESIQFDNLSNLSESHSYSIHNGGSVIGDVTSPRMAIVVQKVTGVRGRSNFGRCYLPRPAESVVNDGSIDTGDLPEVNSFVDLMTEIDLSATGYLQGVVYSRKRSTPSALHTTNITGFRVHSVLGSQRSRLKRLD